MPRIFGTNRGETFLRLAASYSAWVSAISATPSMAVPMTIPVRNGSISMALMARAS